MKSRGCPESPITVSPPLFSTTHWSVVLTAGQQESPQAEEALEKLCRTYWSPLYAYLRRSGCSADDAQDLTQEFFARFLEKGSFSLADPARGRFRTFLLRSLQNFLTDDWRRTHRAKRGGGAINLPLDTVEAEAWYAEELKGPTTPEQAYEERWAITLLEQVVGLMQQAYAQAGKQRLFEALQDFLWDPESSASYPTLAKKLAMTEGALRVVVHRLRQDFRERLRAEVAHTVSDPAEIDGELRHLLSIVSGRA